MTPPRPWYRGVLDTSMSVSDKACGSCRKLGWNVDSISQELWCKVSAIGLRYCLKIFMDLELFEVVDVAQRLKYRPIQSVGEIDVTCYAVFETDPQDVLKPALSPRDSRCLDAIAGLQLAHGLREVVTHCAFGQMQLSGDRS